MHISFFSIETYLCVRFKIGADMHIGIFVFAQIIVPLKKKEVKQLPFFRLYHKFILYIQFTG
jgi:hypothetical protein